MTSLFPRQSRSHWLRWPVKTVASLRRICLGNLEVQSRLADGFIAGVEQRRGLGAIPRASAFLLPGFGVFDVEHAAAFAAVEDVTTFHNSDFLCPML